jgi:hypothetical protein
VVDWLHGGPSEEDANQSNFEAIMPIEDKWLFERLPTVKQHLQGS